MEDKDKQKEKKLPGQLAKSILEYSRRKTPVDFPVGDNETVRLIFKPLDEKACDEIAKLSAAGSNHKEILICCLVHGVEDEQGNPVWESADDLKALDGITLNSLTRLALLHHFRISSIGA